MEMRSAGMPSEEAGGVDDVDVRSGLGTRFFVDCLWC